MILELYQLIENNIVNIVGSKYNISYQTQDSQEVGSLGIYCYASSSDVRELDGSYSYECIKVQLQLQVANDINSIDVGIKELREVVEYFENNDISDNSIDIISCEHIGPKVVMIGKNEYQIPILRTVFDIKYTILI